MPRRKKISKREILSDPKYHSKLIAKFINNVMYSGKKSVAESIMYDALDIIEKKINMSGLEVFQKAIENARPLLEVKSRRVGGATYQVPIEVPANIHNKCYLECKKLKMGHLLNVDAAP